MNRLDERVTTETAAQRLGVDETLIRKWASRYHLTRTRNQYRFRDLVEIEHQTRHSRGSRRKLTNAT